MKHVILDPTSRTASMPPELDGHDVDGCTVLEVDDDFSWNEHVVNWDTLELVGDLSPLLEGRLAQLSAQFELELAKGCDSPKGRVDCDDKAQGRIAGVIKLREEMRALDMPVDETVKWTMLDKSKVDHNEDDLRRLGVAIGIGFALKFAVKQSIESALIEASAAGDKPALEAVNVEEGWP